MKNNTWLSLTVKALLIYLAGVLIGIGISFNYTSLLGSDPTSVVFQALGAKFNISAGTSTLVFNLTVVAIFFFIKRSLIHIGTLLQAIGVGVGIDSGMKVLEIFIEQPQPLIVNLILCITGVLIMGAAIAMYLACDLGASPLDILVLSTCGLIKKSYKWGLFIVYTIFFIVGLSMHGVWGIGTIISIALPGLIVDLLYPSFSKVIKKLPG